MGTRHHRSRVHDGEQRRSRRGHFSRIQRTVGDDTVDRTADFRVAQLRRGAQILAFGRLQLALGGLDFLLLAPGHQRIEVVLRNFVLSSCLGETDGSLIEIFARQGALLVEILTAVVELLFGLQRQLRRLRVALCFLNLFRQSGRGRDRVGGLRLIVGSLIVLSGGGQVAAFQFGEQLSFMNLAAAIHVERFDRRADLGNNRRLRQRKQNGFGRHRLLDGRLLDRNHLNADRRLRLACPWSSPAQTQEQERLRPVKPGAEAPARCSLLPHQSIW